MSTHVIMKKNLAKALMDAGMEHFDLGGVIGGGGAGGILSDVSGAVTTQNTYQAQAPTSASTVGNQQATLAAQLQNEAAGNGPNPAQIQYLQNAQNISQAQANTYAGNRSLNPGLAARMAGNTAANTGQAATAGAAAQQMQQQLAAQGEMEGLTGQEQSGVLGAEGINAQVAQNNANAVNQNESGIVNGIAGAVTGPINSLFAKGGKVSASKHLDAIGRIYHPRKFADGGSTGSSPLLTPGLGGTISVPDVPNFSNAQALRSTPTLNLLQKPSGSTPDLSSTKVSGPAIAGGADSVADLAPIAAMAARGGKIRGKAAVKGDSYKNDTVPALLSPGEEVIDRETLGDPGPMGKMARTVAKYVNEKGSSSKARTFVQHLTAEKDRPKGYGGVVKAKKTLKQRVEDLEKCMGGRVA